MNTPHTNLKLCAWLLTVLSLSTLRGLSQSVPAIGRDPAELPFTGVFPGGAGWTFYVQVPINVTGFGWFDAGHDGLSAPHEISLWRDLSQLTTGPFIDPYNASLVRSATIPGGTEAQLDGSWRTVDFEVPLTLDPGGYEITGTETGDPIAWLNAIQIPSLTDPRITLGAPADGGIPPAEGWDGFILLYGAYLGPMFFIETIPEPSSASSMFVALLICAARRLRRRNPAVWK